MSARRCAGQSGVFRAPPPPPTGHRKHGQEEGDGGKRKAGGEGAQDIQGERRNVLVISEISRGREFFSPALA